MLYRAMTEDINPEAVLAIVSKYYEGFTTYKATGFWKGISENSLIIEVVSEAKNEMATFRKMATDIRDFNKQQAVLIESIANHSELV